MMTKMNSASRLLALLLTALLLVSFAACGMTSGEKSMEPKNAEEAAAMHKELMAQEKAILSENTALWEKVFMAADKGMTMQEDGKNYGEFLLDTIESAKDQFSADELKLLKGEAEKICDIESKLTMLEEKYPKLGEKSMDAMDNMPKNTEEAAAMHKELTAQEKAILSENTALWEKVFMAADKGMTMQEDGKNYGEFLLDTIESAKDQFSADELKLLKGEAEKICDIESKLTMLEKKYPEAAQKSLDGDMNRPADGDMKKPADGDMKKPADGDMQKFPSFEGKDLDGNDVKSDELFSGNAVTVVNFWFTTCGPCVGELAELDALNKDLSGKNGALIGVNSFTLGGNEAAISDAKSVLEKKGASYQNVYFDSDSEAGKFTESLYAYPTTYVVDRNGNIVGDPIVGAITGKAQMDTLKTLIDKAISDNMG